MDYDDNDFQSQNSHLAGEGSNKYPPILQPYALPKFDFDDSLNGHLRFDSLVETEGFLGIEGSENNHWIEDFPRGSSGIVFSSSAAESCAISRHNNVWSEASSSESVEMLLKSVGQDEVVPPHNIESGGCDELGCMIKMEPIPELTGGSLPKAEDEHIQPVPPEGNISVGEFSIVAGDMEGEKHLVIDASQTCGVYVDGGFRIVEGSIASGNDDRITTPIDEVENIEDSIVNQDKTDTAATESLDDNNKGSSVSSIQADCVLPVMQFVSADTSGLNRQTALPLESVKIKDGSACASGSHSDILMCMASKEEIMEEVNIGKEAEDSDVVLSEASDSRVREVCNENVSISLGSPSQISKQKVVDLSTELVIDTQFNQSLSRESPQALTIAHGQEVPVSNSSAVICSAVDPNVDSVVEVTYPQSCLVETNNDSGSQVYHEKPESSLDKKASEGKADESSTTNYEGCYSPSLSRCSAQVLEETQGHEISAALPNALVDVQPPKTCDYKGDAEQSNVLKRNQVVSVSGEENIEFPSDSTDKDSKIISASEKLDSKSQSDAITENRSDVDISQLQRTELPAAAFTSVEEDEENRGNISLESQSNLQSSAIETELVLVSESANSTAAETGGQRNIDQSLSNQNMFTAGSQWEQQELFITETSKENNVELCIIDVTQKQADGAEEQVLMEEQEEVALKNDDEHGLLNVSGEYGIPKQLLPVCFDKPCENTSENSQPCYDSTLEARDKDVGEGSMQRTYDTESVPEISDMPIQEVDLPLKKPCKDASYDAAEPIEEKDGSPRQLAPLPLDKPCDFVTPDGRQDNDSSAADGIKNSQPIAVDISIGDKFDDGRVIHISQLTESPIRSHAPERESGEFKVGGPLSATSLAESPIKFRAPEIGIPFAKSDNPSLSPMLLRAPVLPQIESIPDLPRKETGIEKAKDSKDHKAAVSMDIDTPELKENDSSMVERSFTFEVPPLTNLPRAEVGQKPLTLAIPQVNKVSPIVSGSSSASRVDKVIPKTSQDASHGSLQISDRETIHVNLKGTPERKPRRTSKSATKETSKKGTAPKETVSLREPKSGSRSGNVPPSPGTGQSVKSSEMRHYTPVESSPVKSFGIFPTLSSLPDLNSSSSMSIMFQQPFTDLQQVQLRAQIFVYGALIQGTAPDEAYMMSAFGGPDGGRSNWEKAWRVCIEKQKSHFVNPETPLQARSGPKALDQSNKQSSLLSKVASTPIGRGISKNTDVVNPMIPLSSPLWSIPTPDDTLQSSSLVRTAAVDYQPALNPMHSHQTTPFRNFVGHNTPWLSPGPFRGPWVASPQSDAFDAGARVSVFPITEPVQLTPARELPVPQTSAPSHLLLSPAVQGQSSGFVTVSPLIDSKKMSVSPGQQSTVAKPRKKKKTPVSEEAHQILSRSQLPIIPISHPAGTSNISASVSITVPATIVSESSLNKLVASPCHPTFTGHLMKGNSDVEQKSVLSEETLGKLKEAGVHSDNAAALAAVAVSQNEDIWKLIDQHKNSGLEPEIESRLAYAAVAIAAATAAAKAAAAAASVASSAALQAKQMADEALAPSIFSQGDGNSSFDGCKASPTSSLKGDNATVSSNSAIFAAKEAARRRVEATAAASKQAENMNAIVKAAELAAEAVSQAGKIVTMGDQLLLRKLVEAGPNGFWKLAEDFPEQIDQLGDSNRDQADLIPNTSVKLSKDASSDHDGISASAEDQPRELERSVKLTEGLSDSFIAGGKNMKGKTWRRGPSLAKRDVAYESGTGSKFSFNQHIEDGVAETLENDVIKEGSNVEVFKKNVGLKTAWYAAKVLSLKDGKAYVCFLDLSSEKAGDMVKEWVELEGKTEEFPKIRTARPFAANPFEGTRKRPRTVLGDHLWSAGDRVDAWMQDSWWEGIVTEKSKTDEATFSVQFPAQGETVAVRAWYLRPSLIWKDGKWIEWSRSTKGNRESHEGDTPNEKRARLRSPPAEVGGKDKTTKEVEVLESGKRNGPELNISFTEKAFNIGRSTGNDKSLRMTRTGLQTEGSKVIFGIPKPGKKRKFMEVSKHYVAGQGTKISEPNDSVKFAKYLMPQGSGSGSGSGSRVWKNTYKPEPKEKRLAASKPKLPKPVRGPVVASRTISQKNNNSSSGSLPDDDSNHGENTSGEQKTGSQSFSSSGAMPESSMIFASQDGSSDTHSAKNLSTLTTKVDRASKQKLAPSTGKVAKIEESKVLSENSARSSEGTEPRRSNRRMQPTSRLLEGLQSSLMASKIPSFSSHRTQNRNSSKGK